MIQTNLGAGLRIEDEWSDMRELIASARTIILIISDCLISLRLNPTTGFNPIVGFTSNYWMQKHPLVGCSNLCKVIADSRSHWEVAPYVQPAVQAINKYFNQISNIYIIFPKITCRIFFDVLLHPFEIVRLQNERAVNNCARMVIMH